MAQSWDQMTVDEKINRIREILEDFVDHYNSNVLNRGEEMRRIEERLKKIEEAIGHK